MKKAILLLIPCTLMLCTLLAQAGGVKLSNMDQVKWLLGKWERINTKPGVTGMEYWESISATEFRGKGFALRGRDTISSEILRLAIIDEQLYYIPDVPENKGPVSFLVTVISTNEFTCENPRHDFPTKIRYVLSRDQLKVTISGKDNSMDFFFTKTKTL